MWARIDHRCLHIVFLFFLILVIIHGEVFIVNLGGDLVHVIIHGEVFIVNPISIDQVPSR
jgi:hypothetical protein